MKKLQENKTTINMGMVEDIKSLDKVVVIGYGSVKSNLTGSVSSVKASDFKITSVSRSSIAG
jgi:hypothetical protein